MADGVRLLAVGDICLRGFDITQFTKSARYTILCEEFEAYRGVIIANLECVLTTNKNVNLNKLSLSCHPSLFSKLPRIDLFSLSNNHISDARAAGVKDTIDVLNNKKRSILVTEMISGRPFNQSLCAETG